MSNEDLNVWIAVLIGIMSLVVCVVSLALLDLKRRSMRQRKIQHEEMMELQRQSNTNSYDQTVEVRSPN